MISPVLYAIRKHAPCASSCVACMTFDLSKGVIKSPDELEMPFVSALWTYPQALFMVIDDGYRYRSCRISSQ
jgi:hypothetical protein